MKDHIDTVVAEWARRYPEWDLAGMAIFGRTSRIERLIELRRTDALQQIGLSTSAVDVLAALWRHPEGLRPRDLRTTMMIGSGTLTPILDGLETRGLLVRRLDPDDGRGRNLYLTAEGQRLVPDVVEMLLDIENTLLTKLSKKTRQRLVTDLQLLLDQIDGDDS